MPRKKVLIIIALVVSINILLLLQAGRIRRDTASQIPLPLQCGHWAVIRACGLLGIPVSMTESMSLLPSRARGHSLEELKQAFTVIGLDVSGERKEISDVLTGSGVTVLHLSDPDHFVVVNHLGRHSVIVFDSIGRRRRIPLAVLKKRYRGYCLTLTKPSGIPLPLQRRFPKDGPCLQLDTLYMDKGDIAVSIGDVVYEFPLRNHGNQTLNIHSAAGDCSCLNIQYPDSIPPHSDAVLRASITQIPGSAPRTFEHEIVITSNDPVFPVLSIVAAGNSDTFLYASPASVRFGERSVGKSHLARVFLTYHGEEDQLFDSLVVDCAFPDTTVNVKTREEYEAQSPVIPNVSRFRDLPGMVRVIELIWTPQMTYEMTHGEVRFLVSGADAGPVVVPVSGFATDFDSSHQGKTDSRNHRQL